MPVEFVRLGISKRGAREAADQPPVSNAPSSLLGRVGAWPPLRLGVAYSLAACVGGLLHAFAIDGTRPVLDSLGVMLVGLAGLALYIVVTWFRDDDALAAAVLLVITLLVGTTAASVVAGVVVTRSLNGGLAMLIMRPLSFGVSAFVMIPAAVALIWFSRLASRLIERAAGTDEK